ncbi:hypothetical protein SLEP1_g31288 [Rubroshorea leprosula]|uniref:Peptidase M28 domain-containing protein n=1 Tax=Rubroshorea leprosula TaxID=152421 RepID=A0AAV5K2X5_9ROSI|nr:hypothetical protein SLEP1_g31288 [Rubroshorea leprosula]
MLFMGFQGSHGFMKTHQWRDSIGAFINVEASGTGGPDLVCQSGPGSWPSFVYAQSAIYPVAHSAAQDVFPVIPGDTDYRIFSQDYGNIPGLDIIFLLGDYYYHTSFDTVDRLLPGSMQARGENLLSVLKAFTYSSKLKSAREGESVGASANDYNDERAVFFDYLTWFMVFYSRRVAVVLHSIPVAIFFVMPFFLCLLNSGLLRMLIHATGILLAIIFPIMFSILRLQFSSYAINWFSNPYLVFMMFIPCSLLGLLIPRVIWFSFPLSRCFSSQDTERDPLDLLSQLVVSSEMALSDEARFWGAFGFYALVTLAYLVAGLSGGFLTFFFDVSMLIAWIFFSLMVKSCGHQAFSMFHPLQCLGFVLLFLAISFIGG